MEVLQKLKLALPYDPAIPLLAIYPKEVKTGSRRDICIPIFVAELFIIAKKWKPPNCPSADEWMKKMWYIYTMEYYSAMKKKEILPFVTTWMSLEGIMLREISQTEKDKYCMI